ncbi:hypothetical protein AAFC00_001703 [Neodothiora populina]|uniref:Tyrosine specific protein phosphatases domain-containing protein n=1 Tax=Neodothiora populina TaxID=2781224 RepID=A0ABR3PQ90_9PEZI
MAQPTTTPPPTTTTIAPPFLDIPGISNFRDIGGYASNLPFSPPSPSASSTSPRAHTQNQSIRRALVYRCADPSRVQPDGLARLRDLGVRKVFDLRSITEIKRLGPEWSGVEIEDGAFVTRDSSRRDGDEKEEGEEEEEEEEEEEDEGVIERIWCPVFADKDYGPEKVAIRYSHYAKSGSEGFVQAYTDILENASSAYRTILTHLSGPTPAPCIIHCTAGKDRTGVIVALLYLLCSVPPSVIAHEYSLTDAGLAHLKPLFKERLLKNPALAGNEDGVDNMISSREENMSATVEMIQERYGGAERYMTERLGLSSEQIERLKGNLVVDVQPVF